MLVPPLVASAGPPAGCTTSRVPIRVRFAETDLMAIVHHGNYLLYFEEARVEYLARRGAIYTEWVGQGIHLPVIDARIRYARPARFADLLEVETWVGETTRVTVRFDYRIFRGEESIAAGYTTLACVDDAHVPKRIPAWVSEQLAREERA